MRDLTTFNSPLGPFRYKRLTFGLTNAPELFQRIMEHILSGLEGVIVYLDDLLIFGKDNKEHNRRLKAVLERLDQFNVRISPEKCKFNRTWVEFVGLIFSELGISQSPSKVSAVTNCEPPRTKEEAQSFLGMLAYLGHRNIPDFAEISEPIRRLTHKGVRFVWEQEQQNAFTLLIERLKNLVTLGYYSVSDQTMVYADASSYGLGAVLIQVSTEGTPRPIAFASKALSKADQVLSQVEKEALACVWALETFQYLLKGRHFDLITDHRALLVILGKEKPTSKITSGRIERWCLRIQEFDFRLKHVPSKKMIADFFSRRPSAAMPSEVRMENRQKNM